MTASERPLAGRTVLLTRAAERAGALAERLRELGARVDTRPTIELVPPVDPQAARDAVAGIQGFDWVVFTSANGVRFFDELFRQNQDCGTDELPRIAAIGPATAREAESAGYRVTLVAEDSSSEGLADALAGQIEAGAVVLVVRPESARPLLPRALETIGATARPVAFYRNLAAADVEQVAAAVRAGHYDVVLLCSPSSLERLLETERGEEDELLRALARTRLVAIGPVTASAILRHGLSCAAVAQRPTDEAVLRSLIGLF